LHKEETNPVELASVVEQFDDVVNEANNVELKDEERSHQVGLGTVDPKHISDSQNASVEILESQAQDVELVDESQADTRESPAIIESPLSGGDIEKVRITVRYTQESWTEIFDARKRRLLHGLIKPGATRVISGQAPFNVFLGNSPGVELEINGKPFDHSVYMRRNNTARFLIDDINS
jgi:cytoskeleton protein RodZ